MRQLSPTADCYDSSQQIAWTINAADSDYERARLFKLTVENDGSRADFPANHNQYLF